MTDSHDDNEQKLRPPIPVDVYGDVMEDLWDGKSWGPSDQIPVQDALERHGIVLMQETERAYIAGRTDECDETKPRFPIRRQQKGLT